MMPPPVCEFLPISDVAKLCGLPATRIRAWEERFGWPAPHRTASGHRRYPATVLPDLREAARRLAMGQQPRQIFVDGKPVWASRSVPSKPRIHQADLSVVADIPEPRTEEARRLRAMLLAAWERQDEGAIAALEAQLPMIHPGDRETAVVAVLRALRAAARQAS